MSAAGSGGIRLSPKVVARARAVLAALLVSMLAFSVYGTLTPSAVRCGLPGEVGCPGGIFGAAVLPASSGTQWFTVTMYDWGFWIVDATTGANETNAWNVFEGWTVHVNATSLAPNVAIGGTAYHGLGVEINATGQQLLSLAAPVNTWVQGSFVAPTSEYIHQHIWCTIGCGPGHGNQQAWVLNVIPALPLPKATGSANVTSGPAPLAVAFSGTAAAGTPPYTESWDFGDGSPQVAGLTASHTYTLGGNYSAKFQVTDSKGMVASSSVGVLVFSTAPLTATLTSFVGSSVVPFVSQFSAIAHGGTPPYTFGWAFGDGGTTIGGNLTSHVYTAPGVYAVVATVTDSIHASARALASVTSLPAAGNFPVTVAATPNNGTPSVLVQLKATPAGGTAPYSYLWVFGDGATGVGASAQHQYNQTGAYEITAFVHDAAGHMGAATVSETVTPAGYGGGGGDETPPVGSSLAAALAGSPLTLFPLTTPSDGGTPLLVNASVSVESGTGSGEAINWNFGDGTTAIGAVVSHDFTRTGYYNVSVTATDSGANSGSAVTTVRVLPLAMIIEVNRTSSDAPFALTAAATIVGGAGQYGAVTWSWGDGATGAGDLLNHTYAGTLTGPVTVGASVSDVRGSPVSSTVTVEVFPLLAAVITPTIPGAHATPIDVQLGLTVTGGSGGYSSLPLWTFGDGTSTRAAIPTTHAYQKLGDYRVTVVTNDSLGTLVTAERWVNLTLASPGGAGAGGPPPWVLKGVSNPNEVAMIMIGLVAISGLGMLYRHRRSRPTASSPTRKPGTPASRPAAGRAPAKPRP